MKDYKIGLIVFLFLATIISLFPSSTHSQSLTAEQIYKKVSPTVVVIHAYNSNNELASQGSGVVINDKGYVVTNYHVLEGNDRIEIMHNKEIVPYVDIIGIDVEKDILILKVDNKKFPSIKIGDSNKLTVGQRVYAIGSPLGFENTISEGIISGLRNYDETRKKFIQITASISPGSSGGAIVNDQGELIGISTLTAREGQNLNFAIPIKVVLNIELSSYIKNDSYKKYELFQHGIDAGEKGNYTLSINYFTQFIKEIPNNSDAYLNRGISKDYNGDSTGAVQDYLKAIELNPNSADAFYTLGLFKNDMKEYKGAINYFDKAIELNPNFGEAFANRGISKQHLEDYNGSVQDCDRAIEIDPNDERPYIIRAYTKWSLEDYEGAIQDYTIATNINPSNSLAYVQRGRLKGNVKDFKGAMKDFNKAIELNPNDSFAYYARGWLKYRLDDRYGACLDWSKAGELGDNNAYDDIKEFCK